MAGRGVDILLGGDPCTSKDQQEVKDLGGLHVIGTERHDSRRIDNQLRGRSGRQGDPGSSRFYISLQDDLMRIFGGSRVESLMTRFGLEDSVPIVSGLVSKAIENAQKKVEGLNFDRRKQTLEYDDVLNTHRNVVYSLRRKILELEENEQNRIWMVNKLKSITNFDSSLWYKNENDFGQYQWSVIVKDLSLPIIDLLWMEHLSDMDHVREGIGLRGYAQRDPMVEYKREAHDRFDILINKIYTSISDRVSNVTKILDTQSNTMIDLLKKAKYQQGNIEYGFEDEKGVVNTLDTGFRFTLDGRKLVVSSVESSKDKLKRNDICLCGSGKKYKYCCGKQK